MQKKKIVIVGGGFGGLYAAQHIRDSFSEITLVDKRNFHLFQPLLYQVATGSLAPGNIASPLRRILRRKQNVRVLQQRAIDLDPNRKFIITDTESIPYDFLVVATGVRESYFGHDEWRSSAPGLKTIEDAVEMRRKILSAFEHAENSHDNAERNAWLTFVIIGGGPTGVELAGALAELAKGTLRREFRSIDPTDAKIILVEGGPELLSSYSAASSAAALHSLKEMGVTILLNTRAEELRPGAVKLHQGPNAERILLCTKTALWAAGVQASDFGATLGKRTNSPSDRNGRLMVELDCSLKTFPEIFVIGDLAHFRQPDGTILPGVAPVAIQQARHISQILSEPIPSARRPPFQYRNRGSLAVIGRNNAVVEIGQFRGTGSLGWIIWALVHISFLIEFENKLSVLIQWAWTYIANGRGSRLITAAAEDSGCRVSAEQDHGKMRGAGS